MFMQTSGFKIGVKNEELLEQELTKLGKNSLKTCVLTLNLGAVDERYAMVLPVGTKLQTVLDYLVLDAPTHSFKTWAYTKSAAAVTDGILEEDTELTAFWQPKLHTHI